MKIRVNIPKKIADDFKRESKLLWPDENYAILIGTRLCNDTFYVDSLYYPPNFLVKRSPTNVDVSYEAWDQAKKQAGELDLEVIGDIHSHCYDRTAINGGDCGPSEMDIDQCIPPRRYTGGRITVFGICTVWRRKNSVRSRIRFWPPITKVETNITKS